MSNQDLIKKLQDLKKLEAAGRPQAGWVMSNREILMSQIQPQNKVNTENISEAVYYWQYFGNMFRQRVLQPVAAFLLVVFVMTGYTVTANVAGASLPGEVLYPIKTASEKMQLAFAFSPDKKAQLQMNFASRRVGELQGLIEKHGSENERCPHHAAEIVLVLTLYLKVVREDGAHGEGEHQGEDEDEDK